MCKTRRLHSILRWSDCWGREVGEGGEEMNGPPIINRTLPGCSSRLRLLSPLRFILEADHRRCCSNCSRASAAPTPTTPTAPARRRSWRWREEKPGNWKVETDDDCVSFTRGTKRPLRSHAIPQLPLPSSPLSVSKVSDKGEVKWSEASEQASR